MKQNIPLGPVTPNHWITVVTHGNGNGYSNETTPLKILNPGAAYIHIYHKLLHGLLLVLYTCVTAIYTREWNWTERTKLIRIGLRSLERKRNKNTLPTATIKGVRGRWWWWEIRFLRRRDKAEDFFIVLTDFNVAKTSFKFRVRVYMTMLHIDAEVAKWCYHPHTTNEIEVLNDYD